MLLWDADKGQQKHIEMARCDAGLGGRSWELQDLLAYLADFIKHFPHGYQRDAKNKLVPPFVTGVAGWHCTRRGDWQELGELM